MIGWAGNLQSHGLNGKQKKLTLGIESRVLIGFLEGCAVTFLIKSTLSQQHSFKSRLVLPYNSHNVPHAMATLNKN